MAAIDIGGAAIDRASALGGGGSTNICNQNPANDTGTIDTFELWFVTQAENTKVGTASNDGSNKFTCRDFAAVGTVPAGSKQTFNGLSVDVVVNDVWACYYSSGSLEYDGTGAFSYWYLAGDQFGAGQQTFNLSGVTMAGISVYGTGATPAAAFGCVV